MLLSIQLDQDIDYLKFQAELQTKEHNLPHAAAQKLKEILSDDQIKPEEFINEFNKILTSTENIGWKSFIFLSNVREKFFDQMTKIPWLQFFIILVIFSVLFVLSKNLKLKRPSQKITGIIANILERWVALFGYFVPLVVIYAQYVKFLLPSYPYLHLIVPEFMDIAMNIYLRYPNLINFGYFFGVVFLCLKFKLPKPRFIRFHLIRGIMLLACQGIPDQLVSLLIKSGDYSTQQHVTTILCLFVINLFWILPCLYQAISHTYPRSGFIRDAVEIHLGRDTDEGFKWWDR
jgi:hypothetical protein